MGKSNPDKARKWRGRMDAWKRSGMQAAAFCRRRRLDYQQFLWWRKRLAQESKDGSGAFVPVRFSSGQVEGAADWACEVQSSNGLQVRLREQPGADQLSRWLGVSERGSACG